MGTSQSQERIASIQNDYTKQSKTNHPYFGNHFLLIHRAQRKFMVCKQIIFKFSSELRQFLDEYEKIERKPFNIIYPSLIIKNEGLETCSNYDEVYVYYDLVGKNINQVIKTEGLFCQSKAWFLLNDISKALQILSESYRPHWAICPQNIYQNEYQNYFIFDSFFVIGVDPQSFLMKKLENDELMSQKMQVLLGKGFSISPTEGFEEDCYCLGFVILFLLTGIHHNSLPKDHFQRSEAVKAILHQRRSVLSSEIIDVILQLIEREPLKRMDNYQLRRLLKEKEAEIIRNEQFDYEKSRKRQGESQRQRPQATQQKLQLSKPYNPISVPTSYSPYDYHNNPNLRITPSRNSQIKLLSQSQHHQGMIRARQIQFPQRNLTPFYTNHTASSQNIYQNHQFPQGMDGQIAASDRSNTLTRINSYDRLIPKN